MLLPVLVGVVGLSVDTAWVILVAQQLQNTADSAALAAARHVRSNQALARGSAVTVASLNTAAGEALDLDSNPTNAPDGDVVLGSFDRVTHVFTPTTVAPNAVRVFARRTSSSANGKAPMIFGAAFGVTSVDVERSAIAMSLSIANAGMIALNPEDACSFDISGNGDVNVNHGSIHVNSFDPCAVCASGNASIVTDELRVVGEDCFDGNAELEGSLATGASALSDPLAELPEPPQGTAQPAVTKKNNQTISPGYYGNGIVRTGGTLTCQPGVYYIDAPVGESCSEAQGFSVSGNSTVIAVGCMFYIKRGKIDLNGNGVVTISAPTSGTYADISIFQDRANTCQAELNGNNQMDLLGAIYVPSATVKINGNGDLNCAWLIGWNVDFSGNGDITVDFDPEEATAGGGVFLAD